jgi:hypothetical protein
VIGHRTSPTNIGLALLANLSAYDFGYISAGPLIERTSNTLRTMQGLERFRGHFYNWYDTQTLQPLPPVYVSTVDSGNLAGHLLTLRAGLAALPDCKILGPRLFEGLQDTLRVLVGAPGGTVPAQLVQLQEDLAYAFETPPATLGAARLLLERLAGGAGRLDATPESQARWWASALERECRDALGEMTLLSGLQDSAAFGEIPTLRELAGQQTDAGQRIRARITVIEELSRQAGDFAQMEYDFLYDKGRHLLAVGYNVGERRRDSSYYDLLASEARLCSFVAIAQGQVPQEAWFALGRLLITAGGEPVLLSWSGSMFEYLMPLLVMPQYEDTLLDQTCRAAVHRQIDYGRIRGVPWGISESCYNATDVHLNYQYRAFGVPGAGSPTSWWWRRMPRPSR